MINIKDFKLTKVRPRFLDDLDRKMRSEKTFENNEGLTIVITGVEDYPDSHHID